jgi:ubiquinol-cytochrome c reductase cytochrome c subunit
VRASLVLGLLALVALLVPSSGVGAAEGDAARGEHLYAGSCIQCHGFAGSGAPLSSRAEGSSNRSNGPSSVGGPPLRGVGARAADLYLSTGYMPLLDPTSQPVSRGPGERLLDENEIGDLIAYVASLGKGPPIPTPHPERGNVAEGMSLFTSHCAGCHQIALAGGYVSGAVAPALGNVTPVRVAEAVRVGPYVMPAFPESTISERQLDSIIAYIRATQQAGNPGGWGIGRTGPVPEGMITWLLAASALVGTCVLIGSRLKT